MPSPGNAVPQFTKAGVINSVLITASNTKSDGSGVIATNSFKAFTADATYGSYVEYARFIPTATTADTYTSGTVGRIFVSSVTSGATTSSNTYLMGEVLLPSVLADSSGSAAYPIDFAMNLRLPAGWTVLITNHNDPATNTSWRATVVGGDY